MSSTTSRWTLCGGIGSGKSEVRRMLDAGGIRTIDADSVGHVVLADEAKDLVAERWPDTLREGVIDRGRLGEIVFNDPSELADLEAITHPFIIGRIEADLGSFEGVAVVEAPVLHILSDWRRIVVDARDQTRLERCLARGMTEEEASRRMESQPSRAEWLAAADLVIPNHGSLEELGETVAGALAFLGGG